MAKLLIGSALCALFAGPAWAGEPATMAPANEPLTLTEVQMDGVTAGVLDNLRLGANIAAAIQASAPITANTVAAVGILAEDVVAVGETEVFSGNFADFDQSVNQSGDVSN